MSIEIKISKRRISYKNATKFLLKRVEKVKANKGKELLWILEHPTTFTAGIRSTDNEIIDKRIKVINTNRGGKTTVHNPGQKIIYFVLNLNKRKKDIRKLITAIEKSIIDFLKIYKIFAKSDKKNIGIWVNNKKIAAIGLRVSKWVAFHGCSINLNNNLKEYQKIVPCGLDNQKITSAYKEKGIKIKNMENKLAKIFLRNINNI
tara:strand:- start:967 stop:1578 length:612 start_codon:yes stop_codon:yes gene_type:complete